MDDEVGITRREKAKPKQEPVIKGCCQINPHPLPPPSTSQHWKPPTAVATVAAPTEVKPATSGGFFGWLKRLFGGTSEAHLR